MGMLGRHRNPIAIVALATTLSLPLASARAQDAEEVLGEEAMPRSTWVGESGFVRQGEADIDGPGGGSLDVNRFDIGVLGRFSLAERWRWTNSLFFAVNDYEFDGGGFAAGDPWETTLTTRLVSQVRYGLSDQWGVFGGGVFIFSGESDADWGDSFTGGGLMGVDYRPSDTLFVSLGVSVISQIEDDARVVPQAVFNWQPHERWALRLGSVPASGGAASAGEVAYRIGRPVEIGLGLIYNQRRFRLDDSTPARDGVGEDNSMPLRFRVGWDITEQMAVHFLGGVALAGGLELDDRSGNRLREQDYDPAPYFGVRFVGGF